MSILLRSTWLVPCVVFAAACATSSDSVVAPHAIPSHGGLALGGGDCPYATTTSGILAPINADHSSVFQLTRTIPVKIRVVDCVTGQAVNTLTPQVSLATVGDDGGEAVNELESSSAADEGTMMRSAGDGQYIYNLSTKNSQFDAGRDLAPGRYELTISSPDFESVVVRFALRR